MIKVIKYCCAGCDSVIVQTTQSDMQPVGMVDCQSCLGHACCYLIEDPFDTADYVDELNLILEDLSAALPNSFAAKPKLTAKNKDFCLAINELKEWALEQTAEAEEYTGDTSPVISCKAYSKINVLSEVIEHCWAALEENG